MEKRRFGRTGLDVSVLGFGSAPIGLLRVPEKEVEEILNSLLDHGVNLMDTAANYQEAEVRIGNAIGHRRSEFVLVSKCGGKLPEIDAPAWSPRLIEQSVDRSLRRLQTDHLDVMLLHSCDLATLKAGDALAALVRAREAGKVRFVGYSGDNETVAYAATLSDIAVIQTSVSICDQVNIDLLLPAAAAADIGVMAKRPLANAAWKPLDQQPGEFYKKYASSYTERFHQMNLTPADLGFNGPPQQAWPEIALRFAISFPQVHTAIVGTTNPVNIRQNIASASKGPLPEPAVAKIRNAFRQADPARTWRGLT
jgi:aryl-alcohol dehydrogenase-like predicted oxidoreductase